MPEEPKEDVKPETPQIPHVFQQTDVRQVASEVATRAVKVLELFKEYSKDMNEKEKKSFALWIKEAYDQVGDGRVDDEELFKRVYSEFSPSKPEEKTEEKKEEEKKVSPKGQETPQPSSGVNPGMQTTPYYPLADDENYYEFRNRYYRGTQTIKRIMPDNSDLFKNLLAQLQS